MLYGKDMADLLPNIRCTECNESFERESVNIVRQEDGLLVIKVKCHNCEKCFGMAYLGLELDEIEKSLKDEKEGLNPIDYDDVLDAHKYFKNLDENWQKFMAGKKKKPTKKIK